MFTTCRDRDGRSTRGNIIGRCELNCFRLFNTCRDGDGEGDVGDLGLVKYRVSTYTADERCVRFLAFDTLAFSVV